MLNPTEILVLQTLARGLPLTEDPYGALAQSCNMSPADFMRVVQALKDKGIVRRIGVALRHHKAGVGGNIMTAMAVPAHRLDEIGRALAQYPKISHCYARKTAPDWPYNLYAMAHAADMAQAVDFITQTCADLGIADYILLPTVAELKKSSFVFKG